MTGFIARSMELLSRVAGVPEASDEKSENTAKNDNKSSAETSGDEKTESAGK